MKAYGGVLLVADVLLLILKVLYYIGEAIYRIIVPIEEKSVAGEIVLVTGAGSGIGKEIALKYASLGATVVCWDLNEDGNNATVREIKQLGKTKAFGYKCDVSNREEVFKTAEKVRAEVGNVTILINNAGIVYCRPLLDQTPEEIKRIFSVNVLAHCWTVQAFLPHMIQKNYGHIVALSSMCGLIGVPNVVPYCATKFAVRGLMESLEEEIRAMYQAKTIKSNINFTTIYPYMVDTGMIKNPKIRFPSFMGPVPPKEAAAKIVNAQRRDIRETTVPAYWLYVNNVVRTLPDSVACAIIDFADCSVDPDDYK